MRSGMVIVINKFSEKHFQIAFVRSDAFHHYVGE